MFFDGCADDDGHITFVGQSASRWNTFWQYSLTSNTLCDFSTRLRLCWCLDNPECSMWKPRSLCGRSRWMTKFKAATLTKHWYCRSWSGAERHLRFWGMLFIICTWERLDQQQQQNWRRAGSDPCSCTVHTQRELQWKLPSGLQLHVIQ